MFRFARLTNLRDVFTFAVVGVCCVSLLSCVQSARESCARPIVHSAAPLDSQIVDAHSAASPAPRLKAQVVVFQETEKVPRKIIYEADISLIVKDVSAVETQISALLQQHDGYVAESTIDRTQGEQLSGRWRVRIPVEQFDTFLDEISKLGVAESRHQTAQDVTEEFVDLEAQISNKKKLEERIVKLVEDSTGEIKDVIEVERELARVRGEIEQMEGRLRFLTNRTELTTVSIVAREVQDYVPPQGANVHQSYSAGVVRFHCCAASVWRRFQRGRCVCVSVDRRSECTVSSYSLVYAKAKRRRKNPLCEPASGITRNVSADMDRLSLSPKVQHLRSDRACFSTQFRG